MDVTNAIFNAIYEPTAKIYKKEKMNLNTVSKDKQTL